MSSTVARLSADARCINSASALALSLLLSPIDSPVAVAGVYTDDLSKCLVKSSDGNDRILLVQWMFSAMSLHPAVQPMASVTADQRDAAAKKAAALFIRLLTENCRQEAVDALKYEGSAAIGASFQVLGQVASRDLMTDPQVAKGMSQLGADLGGNEPLKALLKDAGISEKSK